MNIIAVDDERLLLNSLERAIAEAVPGCAPACFSLSASAIDYAKENTVDVAFLDIELGGMNGLTLAKKLKDINGKTNIVFVTGYAQYAVDSYAVAASGYILKPVQAKMIVHALEHLRNPIAPVKRGVYVQTFGNFEVLVHEKPIAFSRARSKEILAYLVDRKGASVNKRELAGILWEDEEYTRSKQIQLQVFIADMIRDLKAAGADKIILRKPLSVDTTTFECDYYGFNRGDAAAVNLYNGEYMTNYSWGEFTLGWLDRKQ